MTLIRRNVVVYIRSEMPYTFYGRVWRILPNGKVLWINAKHEVYESDPDELVVVEGYKGRYDNHYHWLTGELIKSRFIVMPSLRKLKQGLRMIEKYGRFNALYLMRK